ncbi:multicopper oxidase LPR1 homolog 4-like [Zingiber officinale]|uniref:Uncharacterized protein n=1 Tax=Zingiber officinale TaxID=94328 RepID=A0A8J5HRN9_ZINOF|nr:multicopper oxidase LPR1 homolog 4-like [Zingiber officinale]KAG6534112.1 hypothetical protein ZIOFF_007996 [Zingiber officinale]
MSSKRMQMPLLLLLLPLFCQVLVTLAGAEAPAATPPATSQGLQKVARTLQMYVDPLPQMPKIYGFAVEGGSLPSPVPLAIGMYLRTWKFHRDLPATPVFVYGTSSGNATFPGPTIIARHGVQLSVTWENYLPDKHILPFDLTVPTASPKLGGVPTVVHLHGGVHPPQSDGSAFAWFTAGFREVGPKWTQRTYKYPNVQPAGNLWYHDHALGLTRVNLLAGLLGAYIIEEPDIDYPLDLPAGDQYDLHLVIADRSFNIDGSIYMNSTGNNPSIHPQWQPEYFGEVITVNGKAWPFLAVQRRKYRFRILNASNARYFRLALSNGLPFYVVGSDSSYLSAPVKTQTVLLAPAEMADVVIDFSHATTTSAELVNDAAYPFPTGAPAAGALSGKVMKFDILPVGRTPSEDKSKVPPTCVTYAAANTTGSVVKTRYITMYEYVSAAGTPTHLYINGLRLEDPATETPKSGTTELWQVINLTNDNHPLHIHLGMFQAIQATELLNLAAFRSCMTAANDAVKCNVTAHAVGKVVTPPEHERTWKNVVKIEPGYMTSVVVAFKLVDTNQNYPFDATAEPGYVYHCHILDHEDNAMIRPLILV